MLLALFVIHQNQLKNLEQKLILQSQQIIELHKKDIRKDLQQISADLLQLTGHLGFHWSGIKPDQGETIHSLQNEFLNLSAITGRYDQIRFIGLDGMEIVRVNYNNGNPAVVAQDQLQNKASRYYFADAIELQKGEIFTSPLDLNIEHKQVELPLKPMIRFSTPVFDRNDNKVGLLVLNYLAQKVLDSFKQDSASFPGKVMLINRQGYFLIGIQKELEWAFMFNTEKSRLEDIYPELWPLIQHQTRGHLRNQQGLFSFTNLSDASMTFTGIDSPHCLTCNWTAIHFIPEDWINSIALDHITDRAFESAWILLALIVAVLLINIYRQLNIRAREQASQLFNTIANERDLFVGGPTVVFKLRNEYSWPVEWVSENVYKVLGYKAGQLVNGELTYTSIIAPEYLEMVSDNMMMLKSGSANGKQPEPYQLVCADGYKIWVQESSSVVRNKEGRVTHIYGYVNDISYRVEAEQKLQRSYQLNQTVMDTISDPTLVIDVENYQLILANNAAKNVYLKNQEKLEEGMTCYKLSHKSDQPCSGKHDPCPIQQIKHSGTKNRVIHKHFTAEGSAIFVEVVAKPIFDTQGKLVQILESHHDITEQVETETHLRKLATTDSLTKIHNRTKFDTELQMRFEKSRTCNTPLALIMFDIDHFKTVNDNYGHDAGDFVLKEMASLVRSRIRKGDLLARWGGEEFMLLTEYMNSVDLEHKANQLRVTIAEHYFPEIGHVTASFGASYLTQQDSIESLVKRVDKALYQSKVSGRNQVTFFQG